MTMMSLSQNEVSSTVEKALRGVGIDHGRAKDGGAIAAKMAAFDRPFIDGLKRAIEAIDQGQDNDKNALSALSDGLILAEYAAARGWQGQLLFPQFMLAAAAILAEEQGIGLNVGGLDILTRDEMQITLTPDEAEKPKLAQNKNIEVPVKCWQEIEAYAARVYVKETEEKKNSGAGAGDIDNS